MNLVSPTYDCVLASVTALLYIFSHPETKTHQLNRYMVFC